MGRDEKRAQDRHKNKQQKILDKEEPSLTFDFHPNYLNFLGPIIETDIGITETHEKALKENNLHVPPRNKV